MEQTHWLLLLSFFFLPLTLTAQSITGSLVVLQSAGDYIAIAADSKSVGYKGASLHRCKIVALDDQLAYAATGYTSHVRASLFGNEGTWDASDIAKQHYRLLVKTPRHELIRKLAEAYGASLAARLDLGVKTHPKEGWPSLLASVLFAGFDEKQQRVIIEVTVQKQHYNGVAQEVGYSTKVLPAGDAVFAHLMGETAIAQEYVAGKTLRSQSWRNGMAYQNAGLGLKEQLVSGAEEIVELTAKYDPSFVGGPVDAILLSRKAGVTWIRRKPECGTTDSAGSR